MSGKYKGAIITNPESHITYRDIVASLKLLNDKGWDVIPDDKEKVILT